MPSTSRFRVPKATIAGAYGAAILWFCRRTFGEVPDNRYVMWHHRKVLRATLGFERRVARFDALDPHLESFAQLEDGLVTGPATRRRVGLRRTDRGARGAG